jgi:hypothetical protein
MPPGATSINAPCEEAILFCNAISAITLDDASVDEAMRVYQGKDQ